jgi:chromate transport protein ChrA
MTAKKQLLRDEVGGDPNAAEINHVPESGADDKAWNRLRKHLSAIPRLTLFGLRLGATVFGGIVSCYPMLRSEFVRQNWAREEEVDGLYALSYFFPGVPFLNFWGVLATRTGGILGAFLAQICLVLPAFLLVFFLPLSLKIPFIEAHKGMFFNGAIWATTGILLSTGLDNFIKVKSVVLRAFFFVAVAMLFLKVPIILLILCGTIAGSRIFGKTKEAK